MPDTWSRRTLLRTAGATAALGVAGCLDGTSPGTADGTPSNTAPETPGSPTDSPTDSPTAEDDRPTATERSPRPLDVEGTWAQLGSGAGHDGVTDATGVPENGAAYWHLRRIRSGPPVLSDGRLFHYAKLGDDVSGRPTVTRTVAEPVGTAHPVYGEPTLVARDASEGRIAWSRPLPDGGFGWPAVAGARVVSAVRGQLAAFDAASGDRRWRVDLGDESPGDPTVAGESVVVPIQGVVETSGEYVQRPAIRAYGLDGGDERWSVEPPKRANGLAVGDETVAVVSAGWDGTGVVLGLSLADGIERWRTETSGDSFPMPVVADGTAYVASDDDYVRALDLADGSERWRRNFEAGPAGVAVDGETVYAAAGSSLAALSKTDGSVRWQVTPATNRESTVTPAVGADAVYAGTTGGEAPLVALDPADGSERWRRAFPETVVDGDMVMGGVETQPVVAEGGIYVPAVDGLYAFGPTE